MRSKSPPIRLGSPEQAVFTLPGRSERLAPQRKLVAFFRANGKMTGKVGVLSRGPQACAGLETARYQHGNLGA